MSATPSPDSPDMWADAARSAPIGFSMMIARRLLSPDKPPLLDVFLQALAASGVSVLVGWGISDYIASEKLRYAVVGVAGFAAPEVASFAIRWIKARGEAEVTKAKKHLANGKKAPSRRKGR